jgi:hypothetical protein
MSSDYIKYRGTCKEVVEELVAGDESLTAVRGHYFCPIWNKDEPHWWAVDKEGTIIDPTKNQFPSKGHGIYTPFDGMVECSQCGAIKPEAEMSFMGNYAFCSYRCNGKFIGVF